MPEDKAAASSMGDIISSTRQRLEQPEAPADRLRGLVAATAAPKPGGAPPVQREPAGTAVPANYFHQIPAELGVTPKRKPQRGPARSLHISMRLSPPERDRLVRWCDDRNLSLPDGIMALIDLVEGEGGTPK
ncbi:hypothetical protein HJG53_16145 [Sphingomonas sp. ID1715]|jgi:hypothetical protein|uniref:hypothetical protein n=1 Tax=Sphingomonadales TaxID=204457 RepID=UPI000365E697|nr:MULTISPECIES: hypothetical protein [Sphingomonadaceae]ETI65464.1 hypothetical protein C100_01595 [Sphingobium sp. C100]NNM78423.1 hypothetical protein [Sphingomonas sp. ID1715]HUD95451.1 hypothetical protein [Sphingobium sp.]|tara:strand:+ start:1546 stop:1941 length:396 start_codon:yes stop_codon:yes gene_type:complete